MRGHAEGFAENMLAKATQDKPVDMDAAWAAFSGVLTSETIDAADWGATKKKVPGPRSVTVFNITAFQGAEATAPPTPIQHTVFQLTDAKVIVQPTPDGYEVPVGHAQMLLKWTTATGKRKRGGDSDSDSVAEDDEVIDEDDEDGRGRGGEGREEEDDGEGEEDGEYEDGENGSSRGSKKNENWAEDSENPEDASVETFEPTLSLIHI